VTINPLLSLLEQDAAMPIRIEHLAAVTLTAIVVPQTSYACAIAQPRSEVVFYDLPENVPSHAAILLVHFPYSGDLEPGISARRASVQRVVKGAFNAASIDVMVEGAQNGGCRWATTNGKTGYVIGKISKREGGRAAFYPIYESAEQRVSRGGVVRPDPPHRPPEIRPFYIANPEWATKPSPTDLKRILPKQAKGGFDFRYAHFKCNVGINGQLDRCNLISQMPENDSWKKAARAVTTRYRLRPKTRQGWSVEGGQINLLVKRDGSYLDYRKHH